MTIDEAVNLARLSKLTTDEWLRGVRTGKYTATELKATVHYRAHVALMEAAKASPAVPVSPVPVHTWSVFSGRGAFCTSDPEATNRRGCAWVALQGDPEGNMNVPQTAARICYWQARPTLDGVLYANARNAPYIGQAENEREIRKCLELGPSLTVPKALVGNMRLLMQLGLAPEALAQGWDGIAEWYANAHPWETQPDGGGYPRFVNVCFGIYSEGEPGGNGYVPQSKTVADYRAVWHGSFSVWKAEAMTDADWQAFSG